MVLKGVNLQKDINDISNYFIVKDYDYTAMVENKQKLLLLAYFDIFFINMKLFLSHLIDCSVINVNINKICYSIINHLKKTSQIYKFTPSYLRRVSFARVLPLRGLMKFLER